MHRNHWNATNWPFPCNRKIPFLDLQLKQPFWDTPNGSSPCGGFFNPHGICFAISPTQEMFEDPIGGSYLYCILVKKKRGFPALKSLSTKFLALLVFMRGLVTNGLCYAAEAPVVEGDLSNIMPQYLIQLRRFHWFFFQHPTTPAHEVQLPPSWDPHLLLDPQGGNKVDQTLTEVIFFWARELMTMFFPKFEQGPRYYVFSNGNSACNLYFYFAQIAQLYGIFTVATFSPKN